jgi:hypothetical protein
VRRAVRVAAGVAAAVCLLPATSVATDHSHATIDPRGRVAPSGRVVSLSGSIVCAGCGVVTIGVTLSQASTGALAQGGVRCRCSAGPIRMTIRAVARYGTFTPGRAKACAWLVSRGSESTGAARQWCRPLKLVL